MGMGLPMPASVEVDQEKSVIRAEFESNNFDQEQKYRDEGWVDEDGGSALGVVGKLLFVLLVLGGLGGVVFWLSQQGITPSKEAIEAATGGEGAPAAPAAPAPAAPVAAPVAAMGELEAPVPAAEPAADSQA